MFMHESGAGGGLHASMCTLRMPWPPQVQQHDTLTSQFPAKGTATLYLALIVIGHIKSSHAAAMARADAFLDMPVGITIHARL